MILKTGGWCQKSHTDIVEVSYTCTSVSGRGLMWLALYIWWQKCWVLKRSFLTGSWSSECLTWKLFPLLQLSESLIFLTAQYVGEEFSAGRTVCKGFSKTMLNLKTGSHAEVYEQHFMIWFLKMFSDNSWVIYVSFCSSHHISEFINGKNSFFTMFESQDNDCLERPTILIGAALKFITFNLLDIFCNKKWKLFSPCSICVLLFTQLLGKMCFPWRWFSWSPQWDTKPLKYL